MMAYVLIPGVNDTPEDVAARVDFCRPLSAKVNRIPFNPGTDVSYRAPEDREIMAFRDRLVAARMQVQSRSTSTRGRDLMAACGQLGALRRPARFVHCP